MRGDHVMEVHPVKLVAGEDEHVLDVRLLDVTEILPHRVGGPLIPRGIFVGLLGGQDLHEAAAEGVEDIRAANVPVQAYRIELRDDVDPVQSAVDAVGERDVDQPILTRHRDGRFGSELGKRIEARTAPPTQYESNDMVHGKSSQRGAWDSTDRVRTLTTILPEMECIGNRGTTRCSGNWSNPQSLIPNP